VRELSACYYHCCSHPSTLAVSQPPITFAVLLASVLTVAFPTSELLDLKDY